MRDIKFRAWIFNKMIKPISIQKMVHQRKSNIPLRILENEYVFMQYTGLKDKNNIEIYEGDIVRIIDDVGYYGIGKIIFNLCSFCFEWIDDTESNIEPMITVKKINLNQELEVIGNIYENKEIIK